MHVVFLYIISVPYCHDSFFPKAYVKWKNVWRLFPFYITRSTVDVLVIFYVGVHARSCKVNFISYPSHITLTLHIDQMKFYQFC